MSFYCSGSCFALRLVLVAVLVVAGLFEAGAARAGEGADAVGYGAGRVVPAVRWAAPAGGEVVAGVLRGSRCAVGVARGRARQVAFFVDGRRRMVDRRVPYRCRIDTRKLRDGRHRFRAVALDRRGKRRAAAVVVRVRNSGSRVRPRDEGGSPGAVVCSGDFDSGDSLQWASRQCLAGRLTLGSAAPTPFEGGYWARFEVRAGDVEPLTGNNRCELTNPAEPSVFQEGEDVFYRFQVRLGSPWPWEGRWNAIWQLHQQSNSGSPPVVLEAYGSSAAKSRFRLLQAVCCPIGKWWQGPAPVNTDTWYDFIVHVKHSTNPALGFTELWLNGVRQKMANGQTRKYGATIPSGSTYTYSKFGYYRDPGHTGTGVLYGDGYVTATNYAAVAGAY
jgi:hypothetical protein